MEKTELQILIITGMSGGGKTAVAKALEDAGYFCIDNLPPNLFVKFVEGLMLSGGGVKKAALVADVRGGSFFAELVENIRELQALAPCQVLFLEASDDVLLRRYKETRRKHPLAAGGESISDCISRERQLLTPVKSLADVIIDTSDMSNRRISQEIAATYGKGSNELAVSVISFGYKYGLPLEADLALDVRFLPNPFYIEALKPLTGLDEAVRDFVLDKPVTKEAVARFCDLLSFLLPNYLAEGKKHLSIAIGCTGGRHRSVAIAQAVVDYLLGEGYKTNIFHRDIKKADLE